MLGFEVVSIGDGEAVARFPIADRVRQRFGLVHGGAYAALAEMIATEATVAHVTGRVRGDGDLERHELPARARAASAITARGARATTAAARRGCGRSTHTDGEERLVRRQPRDDRGEARV